MKISNPFYRFTCLSLALSLVAPNAFSSATPSSEDVVMMEEISDEQASQTIETMVSEIEKMSEQELKEKLEVRSNELEKLVADGKLSAEDSEKTFFIAEAMKQAAKKPSKFKTKLKSGLRKLGKGAKFGAVLLSVAGRATVQTALSPTTVFLSFLYGLTSKKIDRQGTEWRNGVNSNEWGALVMLQFLAMPNPANVVTFFALAAGAVAAVPGQIICDIEDDKSNPEMRIIRVCDAITKVEKGIHRVAAVIGSTIGVGTHYVVLSPYYGVKAIVKAIKKGQIKRKARRAGKSPVPAPVAPVMP